MVNKATQEVGIVQKNSCISNNTFTKWRKVNGGLTGCYSVLHLFLLSRAQMKG